MLELRDVGFCYPRRDPVFRGVSLTVPPGTTTAVLGPNGRGKTTLVRCAAGLLTPSEGEVVRDGHPGFVPQAHATAFAYTVTDMVLMGRASRVRPFAAPNRRDRLAAEEAMHRVGVLGLADRRFPTLSGGEQQLVLIARAVAAERSVVVLDEPAAALDLRNQARVLSLVRELAAEGMSVLLTTHHPDHASFLADSVVLMMAVEDVRVGPADAMLTDSLLTELYGVEVRTLAAPGGDGQRAIVPRYDVARYDVPGVSRSPSQGPSAPPARS